MLNIWMTCVSWLTELQMWPLKISYFGTWISTGLHIRVQLNKKVSPDMFVIYHKWFYNRSESLLTMLAKHLPHVLSIIYKMSPEWGGFCGDQQSSETPEWFTTRCPRNSFLNAFSKMPKTNWVDVNATQDPEASSDIFMNIFMRIVDNHAPRSCVKCSAKSRQASWLNESVKYFMRKRGTFKWVKPDLWKKQTKILSIKKSSEKSEQRNEQGINAVKQKGNSRDSLKGIMGRGSYFVESDGMFPTKPSNITN